MREEWSLIIPILDQKFWSLLCTANIRAQDILHSAGSVLYYVELNFYLFSIVNTYIRKLWKTEYFLTIQPILYRFKQAPEILILNKSWNFVQR